ncbi:BAI1-associated protein 3 [Nephila pilipes]|uniref:BAI1-associated protein 3 n=1 Tax=Nephila pilipes TaxID=299642 RepID=A0A8X6UH12_NEPPI|nr:BAI1-associated protein 3 [Nephila pilipes]
MLLRAVNKQLKRRNIQFLLTNMLEQTVSMYIVDILDKDRTQPLFFPLTELFQSDILVKWRILEKIASIKVMPQQTIYKHKLTEFLRKRIQDEVGNWLDQEFSKLKMSGKSTVLKDIEILTKILKDFKTQLDVAVDFVSVEGSLFKEASCCYFDCLSKTLDEKLHPICLQIMKSMDIYQEYHRTFHVNLRDSCALSHALYLQVKHLVHCLRHRKKTPQSWKLEDYNSMFVKFFMNLLQVVKSECHNRIKRAIQVGTKDSIHSEERILSCSVIVLNCFCTVIDEWKHLEIEDEDLQVAFLIKIVDIICDGAKIFAEALDDTLSKEILLLSNADIVKKACILANSVEHVRKYLEDLPHQMQWKHSLNKLNEESTDTSFSDQVMRILNLIHQSMDSDLNCIVAKNLNTATTNLQSQYEKSLSTWLQASNLLQGYERFLCHFNEYLESVNECLKDELFPKFLSFLWVSTLMYIQNGFQEGQSPEYAKTIKENIHSLLDYLLYMKMEDTDAYKPLLRQLMSILDLNSKTTVDLQLDYYNHIAESIVSPVEYLGHIAFQAGYKLTGEDYVDFYINIQKGQRLPARKFEMNELYVKLTLCPSSLFPNQIPLKSTPVTEDLDNPVFNQFFQFSNLPAKILSIKGAVVQVLVLNQNKSYSAEAVLLLKQVQNMSGFASLEFLPVYLMPLKKFDMSQISYQVLENRSRWDKNAKFFINSRNKAVKSQKISLSCIPGRNQCLF